MALPLLSTRPLARIVARSPHYPVLDFLAPRTIPHALHQKSRIHTVSPLEAQHAVLPQDTKLDTNTPPNPPTKAPPPLTPSQRDFLDSALRVNQAGELAAVLIYTAQTPPLIRSYPHLRPLMQHMHDQEVGHFRLFNTLLAKHRVRPTLMYPVWHAAATALGWGTAIMGREAAMACTEAVETEIGGHYNEQVQVLLEWAGRLQERGELGEELQGLIGELRRIRDEELEHLDHAVQNDSKEAKPYELLTNVIRGGCRTAIWISEKV
ncbi:COQ7-domain-containing protein [Pleomassaria siparia CBS 279.74]|uniref:5-demethoxyubiquinone hydroxylase, mitochondrial n=1 Tax=Pleomassaria siparia CBS 279.74 TaxID=1314801 RepID=A0A6G1K2W6_9PLEO|nr:COQ7-domain-containing protein [Pleomassaria siparia CBS 279.74]